VIAYASRSLRQNEKGYSPIRFELLSMKWALCEAFHTYLHDCPNKIVVFTDNKPLAYMAEARHNNLTIARWAVELKEVDV
jgi:RNase H-like domain found in reverse transcriptase